RPRTQPPECRLVGNPQLEILLEPGADGHRQARGNLGIDRAVFASRCRMWATSLGWRGGDDLRLERLDHDVRLDPGPLERTAGRGEVARGRELEAAAVREVEEGLHRALAVARQPEHGRAPVILQRTSDDLGGRGGALVDQDDHREPGPGAVRARHLGLDVAAAAARHLHDEAAFQEQVADLDRLVVEAAGVAAQVEQEDADRSAELALQVAQRRLAVRGGRVLELADRDVADPRRQREPLDGRHLDALAHQHAPLRPAGVATRDHQLEPGAGLPAQERGELARAPLDRGGAGALLDGRPAAELDDAIAV